MASAVTIQKLFANAMIQMWDHDPGTTDATITSPDGGTTKRYVAMKDFEGFAAMVMTSVSASSSGPSLVEIVGATDATGTNATAIVTSGTVDADAVGDWVAVECTAAQINEVGKAAGYNFTHVGVRITTSNAGDECVVTYIRHAPRFAYKDLTATTIS